MKVAQLMTLAVGLSSAACAIDDQGTTPVGPSGNLADFSTYVQPVLQVGCASLDCHGVAGRPLRLYALNGLRIDATLRGEDASDAEMLSNMIAIGGLDPGRARIEDHLLLLKPLAVDAGGLHHVGGDLWDDQNDSAYRCLHAWLRAGASDDAGKAICTQAAP